MVKNFKLLRLVYIDYALLIYLICATLTIVKIENAKLRFLPIMLFIFSHFLYCFPNSLSLLKKQQSNPKFLLLISYVVFAATSFIHSFDIESVSRWIMMFLHLFFLVVVFESDRALIWKQLKLYLFVLLPTLFVPVLSDEPGNIGKLTSIYSTHNVLGVAIAGALYIASVTLDLKKKWLVFILCSIPLYYARSRSSILFYFIFVGIVAFDDLKCPRGLLRYLIGLGLLFILSLYGFFLNFSNQDKLLHLARRYTTLENPQFVLTMRGREGLVIAAIKRSLETPLGIGLGRSAGKTKHHFNKLTPHNATIKMLLENGYLSALMALIFMLYFSTKLQIIHLAMFVAFFCKNLFESVTFLGITLGSVLIIFPFFLSQKEEETEK